jgi:ABC-type glycerol-3-phosphate transport system substrate-binding protein
MDEFEGRLRERLLKLAAAASLDPARLAVDGVRPVRRLGRMKTAVPMGAAAVAIVLVLAVVIMALRPMLNAPAATPSPTLHPSPSPVHGAVVAWGNNDKGQTDVPAGLSNVVAISAGFGHSLALRSDGSVVAWGDNSSGQTDVPAGLSGVVAISTEHSHNLALRNDGTVVAWGDNRYGQTTVPAGLSGVVAIAAGGGHSLALRSDGTVVAWGDNSSGQSTVPAGLSGVTAISAGDFFSLALRSDGTVVAWGENYDGLTEVPAGLSDVVAISGHGFHALALRRDGTVVAWGMDAEGEGSVPSGLSGVAAVSAGQTQSYVLRNDTTVFAWGANYEGQTQVPAGLSNVTAIAGGGGHCLALLSLYYPEPSEPAVTPTPSMTAPADICGDAVVVRWFVGLGSGTQPDQIEAEKAFVNGWNAAHCDSVYINLEIVPNADAYDTLKAEIAAGNAPDIIGPIGMGGRNGFGGLFLDLAPLVAEHKTDLSGYEPAVVDYFKDAKDGQVGLPYLMYPGYIFYNKDMFNAAALPDLPHRVGQQYQGKDWTWETLRTVAMQLTLDTNGKNRTQEGFDPNRIVQYGMGFTWADARRIGSCFGGGSFVAADGKTAQIPTAWWYAWNWYYDAMWKDDFAPTHYSFGFDPVECPNCSASAIGHEAMAASWPWAIPSYGTLDVEGKSTARFSNWDIAVMPSYQGRTSSPLDADTFVIASASQHPDEAYQAMLAIMADPTLKAVYGGMPALESDQPAYFSELDASLAKIFPGNEVDWSVLTEMSKYPALPSHQADMPNATKVINLYSAFLTKLENTRNLNVDQQIARLKEDIQAAFDASGPPG